MDVHNHQCPDKPATPLNRLLDSAVGDIVAIGTLVFAAASAVIIVGFTTTSGTVDGCSDTARRSFYGHERRDVEVRR